MGLFGKSTFLDADVEDWCLETWGWLLGNLGGMPRFKLIPLVTASREFFPPTETTGHERALYVFDRVRSLMAMEGWPAELEPLERLEAVQRVGTYAALRRRQHTPSGTFRIEDGKVFITYATDLIDEPRKLIATLSHELSHYLLATFRQPIPGGNHLHELATELTVAFTGFGIFGANSAFHFQQHQDPFGQGWTTQRHGYLSERTWAFALALFAELRGVEIPRDQLKSSVADLTRKAQGYLKRNEALLAPLRAIA